MSGRSKNDFLLITSNRDVKEFTNYFKSMNASVPKENALDISENHDTNTPKSNINIKKKAHWYEDKSEPLTLKRANSDDGIEEAQPHGDT